MNTQRISFLLVVLWATAASAQSAEPAPQPTPQPAPQQADAEPAPGAPAADAAQQPAAADAAAAQPATGPQAAPAAATAPADGSVAPDAAPAKPVIAADPAVLEKAKGHFKQGLAFAKSGDCSAAIVEFQTAYEVIPRPNMLYNIAQCQERLFRYDLAVQYYERYLGEAPEDAPDRPAVKAALSTLGNLLGTVTIAINVHAEVWVDDRLAGNAPGKVLIPAGGHSLEVRAKGYIPDQAEVRVVGRTETDIEFTLVKAQTTIEVTETTGVSPTLFWVGATATVVAGAVGGFFAVQALSRASQTEDIDAFHPERNDGKSMTESSELAADVSFIVAGALALGTTIVAFMTDWDGAGNATAAAKEEHSNLKVAPTVGLDSMGIAVEGTL